MTFIQILKYFKAIFCPHSTHIHHVYVAYPPTDSVVSITAGNEVSGLNPEPRRMSFRHGRPALQQT